VLDLKQYATKFIEKSSNQGMPLFPFIEKLAKSMKNQTPVGNDDANDAASLSTPAAEKADSTAINQVGIAKDISELKKMVKDTQQKVDQSQQHMANMQSTMEKNKQDILGQMADMQKDFESVQKNLVQAKDSDNKVKSAVEKEIIGNAHIDANKQAIQSKQREKDRIQKIMDTNNVSADAKNTLLKDMDRINSEIDSTEKQNEIIKNMVDKSATNKVDEEIK
jgi:hypothetical protein